ncbi:MAG: glycosyltransferase family 2 protein [Chloroflexi bacterium]|nr:MAG: glycosyltransferase family 2 protein [Chloroflexota bacterium]
MTAAVTAIVLTLNEAEHLPDCLDSLAPLTSDVIVFDSGSTDLTIDIAREHGARVEVRAFDGYANQRNAALALAGLQPWVLFLDADERLSPAGAREIRTAVDAASPQVDALLLPRSNVFFGRTLRGGGWWPDYQARVLRVGRVRYDLSRQVHEVVQCEGERICLSAPILHLNYVTWAEFREKQRAYSVRELSGDCQQLGPPRRRAYLTSPAREFYRRFIALRGYRDGILGLRLAFAMAHEQLWMTRQLRQLRGS